MGCQCPGVSGQYVNGQCPGVSGQCPGVSGQCPGVSGQCPGVSGQCPGVSGELVDPQTPFLQGLNTILLNCV